MLLLKPEIPVGDSSVDGRPECVDWIKEVDNETQWQAVESGAES
jgi:hypothetical protein